MKWAFWRKAPEIVRSPEQRLYDAVDEINEAWAELGAAGSSLSLWVNWDEREITVTQWNPAQARQQVYP